MCFFRLFGYFSINETFGLLLHTHDLRISMNERTDFFIKIYLSHFILERVDISVVCERWVKRHILSERTSSHIFFQEPAVPTLAPPCKLVRDASARLRVPRSTAIPCPQSKSASVVLVTSSPSGYIPVVPECSDHTAVYLWKFDILPKHSGSLGTNRKSMSYVI